MVWANGTGQDWSGVGSETAIPGMAKLVHSFTH